MKLTKWAALISTAIILSGCATAGDFCLVAAPIKPSVDDQVTDGTKRQIVSHNTYGEAACGWRP